MVYRSREGGEVQGFGWTVADPSDEGQLRSGRRQDFLTRLFSVVPPLPERAPLLSRYPFPAACLLLQEHFAPLGLEARMDSPHSMLVRIFQADSGATLVSIAGIACSASLHRDDIARIIDEIESDIRLLQPQLLSANTDLYSTG